MVELDSSTEALLMDALRQLDEYKRLQKDLPAMTSKLQLATPLTPPLRDLQPDQLDVIQLAHNFGTLGGVLDHSDKDDVQTAEQLVALMKKGYLAAV